MRLHECVDCCEFLARVTASGEAESLVRAALLTLHWMCRLQLFTPKAAAAMGESELFDSCMRKDSRLGTSA
jgi:hypothetical protein